MQLTDATGVWSFKKDHYAYFVADKESDEAFGLCAIKETEPGHLRKLQSILSLSMTILKIVWVILLIFLSMLL
ncbi:hypothetical protein SAMN02910371_01085 [Butyrivibrio sp. INlla14]|nr:hypothetical protein SAMN02910371_01085 [Butyrivibrio sp. INlla14]